MHTTTRLHPLDVTRVGRFPVSSGARTIVDLCAVGITDDQVSAAIGSAIRDGFTSEAFLRQRLRQLRGSGRHGVRGLDRVLEGPIAHSHLERAFLKLVRGAGIRDPETQVIFDGERVIRVDAWWRPEHVVSELMGHRFHVTREQQQRDAQRRNELQELGELVLEFTAADVAYRPMQTIGRLRRVLAKGRARAA